MEHNWDIDSHKLIYHPERVAEWKEKGDCYPIYIEISPTIRCNHDCIFCALNYLERENKNIDKELMVATLKNMADHGVKSVMFAGEGEPLLHESIGLFTQKARESCLDVSITTNGTRFDELKREQCLPNLSWIKFSIDSGDRENYSQVHKTSPKDFDRLMINIEESINYRNKNKLKTTIGTQFLTVPQNIDTVAELVNRLKNIGVDYLVIKPYSYHPKSKRNLSIPFSRYNELEEELKKIDSGKLNIIFRKLTACRIEEGITYKKCYGLPFSALIDVDGNIIPCNLFHGDPEFSYGNLYEKSFSEIWESDRRKDILRKIEEKGVSECRKGCRLDAINRYLDRIKNPHHHDNFI